MPFKQPGRCGRDAAGIALCRLAPVLAVLLGGCVPGPRVKEAPKGGVTLMVAASPGKQYRGTIESIEHAGKQLLINRVDLEDYVKGVLPGEVPPSWNMEALKAMAIVARTYAWHKWSRGGGGMVPLSNDTRDQRYCGFACEHARTNQAAEATRGIVLRCEGEPVPAFSHSCCAGHTASATEVWGGEAPRALRGVACTWCKDSRHYGPWIMLVDKEVLARRLRACLPADAAVREVIFRGQSDSGRVKEVLLVTDRGTNSLSADRFRALVGYNDLRSTRMEVEDQGDTVRFTGAGWGHGVGLCQEGARARAEAGWSCRDILLYYFPGARLSALPL